MSDKQSNCIDEFWAQEAGISVRFYKDQRGQIEIAIFKDGEVLASATTQRHHAADISFIFEDVAKERNVDDYNTKHINRKTAA